jgi:hypothetical protein
MKFTAIVLTVVAAANQFSPTFAGAPQTVADSASTFDGDAITIEVLLNDKDSDGVLFDPDVSDPYGTDIDFATVEVTSGPSTDFATFVNVLDGSILFTPTLGKTGTFSFTYKVSDEGSPDVRRRLGGFSLATQSDNAIVTVEVKEVPEAGPGFQSENTVSNEEAGNQGPQVLALFATNLPGTSKESIAGLHSRVAGGPKTFLVDTNQENQQAIAEANRNAFLCGMRWSNC